MSEERSNPTSRALRVIEVLARSDEPLGLSVLAREAGLAKATCFAIVGAATATGWIAQDERTRRYSIGPALVGATAAVRRHFGDWGPAIPLLAELGRSLGGATSVLLPLHDELITVAASTAIDPVSQFVPTGHRVVFAPPFGAASVLRSSPAVFESWMARAEPALDEAQSAALRRAVRVAVRPGWIATSMTGASRSASLSLATLHRSSNAADYLEASAGLARELRAGPYLLGPLTGRARATVGSVSAPLPLTTPGPHPVVYADLRGETLTGRALEAAGIELCAVAARIAECCQMPTQTPR